MEKDVGPRPKAPDPSDPADKPSPRATSGAQDWAGAGAKKEWTSQLNNAYAEVLQNRAVLHDLASWARAGVQGEPPRAPRT